MNREPLEQADLFCVVPSGGLGSRLGPLTTDRAKPSIALRFDNDGHIERMIDVPLRAIKAVGGVALVSTFFAAESLDFVKEYDHVSTVHETRPGGPVNTLLDSMEVLERSPSSFVGVIAGDTWIEEGVLTDMQTTLDTTGCDAIILSTQNKEGHNVRPITRTGLMCSSEQGVDTIADLGVHMLRKDWLLSRLSLLDETQRAQPLDIWNDIYHVSKPIGDILMHTPSFKFNWVDMGTIPALYRVIYDLNVRNTDKQSNIVFPGGKINSASSQTVALPNGISELILNRAIIPEDHRIDSIASVSLAKID